MNATATLGESDAMQIGRDDYKAYADTNWATNLPRATPFPQGSEDAREWAIGWQREADGK